MFFFLQEVLNGRMRHLRNRDLDAAMPLQRHPMWLLHLINGSESLLKTYANKLTSLILYNNITNKMY